MTNARLCTHKLGVNPDNFLLYLDFVRMEIDKLESGQDTQEPTWVLADAGAGPTLDCLQ